MKTLFSLSKMAAIVLIIGFITITSALSAGKVAATELTIAFFDQPEARAKSIMLQYILQNNTDYIVTLKETAVEDMWEGVAQGKYDGSVSVMLPIQNEFLKKYEDQVDDLGPNWIGKDYSIHTIVRKDYARDDVLIVRFLNNYCLCGERLNSVMSLIEDDNISPEEASDWMTKHEAWITNMMGFVRPYDDREKRGVTY